MTIKIVLSSPLRTLPQSLRDSSLSEGAFEKFAAILFCSCRWFLRATDGRPYNIWCGLVCRHMFVLIVDSEATCCPDALSLQ